MRWLGVTLVGWLVLIAACGNEGNTSTKPSSSTTVSPTQIATPPFAAWPDCETIAAQDLPETLVVFDAETCETKSIRGATNASAMTWSPDGSAIAYLSADDYLTFRPDTDVYVADVNSGEITRVTNTPGVSEEDPIWSPDGTRLLYGTFDRSLLSDPTERSWTENLEVSDLTTGAKFVATSGLKCAGNYSWFADGVSIAVTSGCAESRHVDVVDLQTGEATLLTGAVDVPQAQPSGELTAFPCVAEPLSSTICIAKSDGTEAKRVEASSITNDPSGTLATPEESSPMWSSDGRTIGFQGLHGYYYVYQVEEERGRAIDFGAENSLPAFLTSEVFSSIDCDDNGGQPCAPFVLRSRRLDLSETRDILVFDCGIAGATWSADGTRLAISSAPVFPCL